MGSTGFGAWREPAAHTMTTAWVLTGGYPGFPLTHHWRILPGPPPGENAVATMFGGIDGAVARWDGSAAVGRRLEAIAETGSKAGSTAPPSPRTWRRSSTATRP
jgi:hypothetical protein